MKSVRWAFTSAFCLLPFALLVAQQPTFRTGVTLVTTDVIARGDRGQFIADLTRENFTVLEDGQPQRVESFVMVQGGRSYNLLTPSTPTAAPMVWCCRSPGRKAATQTDASSSS
jgi:hypothetical protein